MLNLGSESNRSIDDSYNKELTPKQSYQFNRYRKGLGLMPGYYSNVNEDGIPITNQSGSQGVTLTPSFGKQRS